MSKIHSLLWTFSNSVDVVDTKTTQQDPVMDTLLEKLLLSRREYKTKEKLQMQQQQHMLNPIISSELNASEILESIYKIQ